MNHKIFNSLNFNTIINFVKTDNSDKLALNTETELNNDKDIIYNSKQTVIR